MFACLPIVNSISQHQQTRQCGSSCWQCALRETHAVSYPRESATDLEPVWTEPLRGLQLTFDRQQDPLEFLGKLAAIDLGVLNILTVEYLQTRSHEVRCQCPIELPTCQPVLAPHPVALISLPPFDETAALDLTDLLLPHSEEIVDGGLECPLCKVKSVLHQVSSWHLGDVALIQLVREADPGLPLNRTAVFAPPEFEHANYVYRLRAAVLHRGDSYHRGHYVAFVLAPDDVWVQYNDGDAPKRFPTDPSHLQTHARYFLYERVQEAISPRSSSPTEVGSFDYTFC